MGGDRQWWQCDVYACSGDCDYDVTHSCVATVYGRNAREADCMAQRMRAAFDQWQQHRTLYDYTPARMIPEPPCNECGKRRPLTLASSHEPIDIADMLLCVECHLDLCGPGDCTGEICEHCLPQLNQVERERVAVEQIKPRRVLP